MNAAMVGDREIHHHHTMIAQGRSSVQPFEIGLPAKWRDAPDAPSTRPQTLRSDGSTLRGAHLAGSGGTDLKRLAANQPGQPVRDYFARNNHRKIHRPRPTLRWHGSCGIRPARRAPRPAPRPVCMRACSQREQELLRRRVHVFVLSTLATRIIGVNDPGARGIGQSTPFARLLRRGARKPWPAHRACVIRCHALSLSSSRRTRYS